MNIMHIQNLPDDLKSTRDALRCIGYELVHFTKSYALSVATPIRHSPEDYCFGFHKIFNIYGEDVVIERNTRIYSSREQVLRWANYFFEQEKPATAWEMASWFKDPINLFISVVVPPYGLALFCIGVWQNNGKAKEQAIIKNKLHSLNETPKFYEKHTRKK